MDKSAVSSQVVAHSCSAEVILTEVCLSVCLFFVWELKRYIEVNCRITAAMEKYDIGEKTVAEYLDTLAHILSEPTRLSLT